MLPQRLRSSGRAIFRTVSGKSLGGGGAESSVSRAMALPNIKRRLSNSLSAVQETYLSTKEVFETHRVVFTVGTSIASVLTAWTGYTLRHVQQSKLEKRLGSIEQAMKNNNDVKHEEIKKIVSSGTVSTAACVATACTSLLLGYGLGWRGGAWYANRKFRREHLKKMGQIKPRRWQFFRSPLVRFKNTRAAPAQETTDLSPAISSNSSAYQEAHKLC